MRRTLMAAAALVVLCVAFPSLAEEAAHGPELKAGLPVWLWKTFNLAAFLGVLWWFVGRPISQLLERRRCDIAEQLAESERQLAESEAMREQLMERLSAVEHEVTELRERAEVEGKNESERIRVAAEAERVRLEGRIDTEISRRRKEATDQLADEAKRLTAEIARELLESKITEADRAKVLDVALGSVAELDMGGN